MPFSRWLFHDPQGAVADYTVPRNPRDMGPLFSTRNITTQHTTAPAGQHVVFEGAPQPSNWEFSGRTVDQAHHDALKLWSDVANRITITIHDGRVVTVVPVRFEPTPKRDKDDPLWRYEYTWRSIVLDVT